MIRSGQHLEVENIMVTYSAVKENRGRKNALEEI